jgi:hypothetical protein
MLVGTPRGLTTLDCSADLVLKNLVDWCDRTDRTDGTLYRRESHGVDGRTWEARGACAIAMILCARLCSIAR